MNNSDFQKIINYTFQNPALLEKALTHSSYIKERKDRCGKNNERLEFLGDAFFDAIISEELFRKLDQVEEGTLTKMRAKIVCEKSLAAEGRRLRVGEHMKMGRGEDLSGGRKRDSIIADAMEAVIGAIFLDGGYVEAKRFVLAVFEETIGKALSGRLHTDYKTEIQERLQVGGEAEISYQIDSEEGPDHDKTFHVKLIYNWKAIGAGIGKSKKEAEQNAAREALERGEGVVF
ncbi:MAG: ribonuclease III [Anaerovorax sp.]